MRLIVTCYMIHQIAIDYQTSMILTKPYLEFFCTEI